VDWWVNFADPELFIAYSGSLMAQDELQVLEHPILGSLREHLDATGAVRPVTVDGYNPTPILIRDVERRVALDLSPLPEADFPQGLYGNEFSRAPSDVVERALEVLRPPQRSNLIALAAPRPGSGCYSLSEIESALRTAVIGFGAAVRESRRERAAPSSGTAVHTGFWGCGAFGGDRSLMVGLQTLAAHAAGLDRIVFHAVTEAGLGDIEAGLALGEELLPESGSRRRFGDVVEDCVSRRIPWGVSDGT
jgi:hypothetical protein